MRFRNFLNNFWKLSKVLRRPRGGGIPHMADTKSPPPRKKPDYAHAALEWALIIACIFTRNAEEQVLFFVIFRIIEFDELFIDV